MTDREARAARNQLESLAAFIDRKTEFDELVADLQQMSADHFGADPHEMLWGKAAEVGHWNRLLRQVTDAYFRRGEYAA
ncbi:MAG: hypothetical protein IT555_11850 [Acetobacteraceae bacterium]|nr:hypothetical protein [Acetobacteraceae bacterium]